MARNKNEHHLQVVIVQWLDLMNYDFFAIPNGGLRNIRVASQLKQEGVKAGVADLFICKSNANYHGLFVELKIGSNKQQPSQIEFEAIVKKHGYQYAVIKSLDQMMELLKQYESEKANARSYADGYKDGQLNAQITKI